MDLSWSMAFAPICQNREDKLARGPAERKASFREIVEPWKWIKTKANQTEILRHQEDRLINQNLPPVNTVRALAEQEQMALWSFYVSVCYTGKNALGLGCNKQLLKKLVDFEMWFYSNNVMIHLFFFG